MNLNKLSAYFLCATVAVFLMVANVAAQPSLGTAANFAVLANSGITSTGVAGTVVTGGNVGSGPTTPTIIGFPPAVVTPPGTLYTTANAVTALANHDLGIAYGNISAMAPTQTFPNGDGQLNNLILGPGVYRVGAATTAQLAAGTLTLDAGNAPGAVFVFQIPGTTLKTAGATKILLLNQAQSCNVFWQVGTSATLGASSTFVGSMLADTSITVGNSVTVAGRLLAGAVTASGAITLDQDQVTTTACAAIPPPTGSIQIVKNAVGGTGTFAFTSAALGPFSLTTSGVGNTANQTFIGLAPGVYSVSETAQAGWSATSSCNNGTIGAINVVAGATTICTFTNTQQGSIQIVKNAVGGTGTFAFTGGLGPFSLTTSGAGNTASQSFINLNPGTYSVLETAQAGWTPTSSSCSNASPTGAIVVTPGAAIVCTFTNTQQGSIKVVKNTVGGDAVFAFNSNFGLASLATAGGTATQTFNNLTPGGAYNVSETLPSGWTQTGASCSNGTPAAVTVVAGATTTCTFTNAQAGSIKVVKNTVGGNGTFAFTSTFGLTSLTTSGTTSGGTASQTFSNLTAGSGYSLSETVPASWTQTSAICTNGTPANITVAPGATTTCVITNTTTAPPPVGLITIVKNTVGGNGAFAFTSNFGLTSLTTSGGTASQTFANLTPGSTYSVSETVPAGWTQTSATCTNGTPGAITVVAGVTTICTFTNTQQAAITIVKNTVGGNGTFTFTSNFGLTSPLTTVGGTVSQTIGGLIPGGSYNVSETVPSGWTQTSAICSNGTPAAITVVAGAATTCIFTNTQQGAIKVVKNTIGGDGTFAFTSNFGLTSLTTSSGTATQTFSLAPGASFSLSETVPSGWTQNSATCSNGTPAAIIVTAGATTTCTIINAKGAASLPDVTISKSHAGNFRQGDTGDTYTLTVSNLGPGPTIGLVTASDTLPAGLTATDISGTGWSCTLTSLTCTRSDVLAAGASFPVITVTVNVANNSSAFPAVPGSPVFQTGDILISMTDGTVQWWRQPWMQVKVLPTLTDGQAKGMAFDTFNNLYVTHWYGAGLSGNDVATFNQYGNSTGLFGSGYDCNPSSIVFDNSGNAYVGHADCSTAILKFGPLGNSLARYSVAVENRGTYDIGLDNNQCTMYYTSEGPDVLRFNVCTNTQMSNFNSAPLPDPVAGAFALLPGGGMLVANSSVITSLDASGKFVRTYSTPNNSCWLGLALDLDGVSFWASDWCASSVTRFNIATGAVIESHVISNIGYMVKRIAIPKNIFSTTVINTAVVAGGGEVNLSNDSASDATIINPPVPIAAPATNVAGTVNAAGFGPTVAAGSIASVFGINLSVGTATASTLPLPFTLASSSLQIGGQAAPLFYASPSQLNLQVPWGLAGQTAAGITVTVGTLTSDQETVNIAPFAPGLFTLNIAGSSQGAILIASTGQFAAPPSVPGSQIASAGQVLSIFCTGLGPVSNQPATGAAALANPLSATPTTPTVTIGGLPALVSFSGLAPGAVGLYQVNVQVPTGTPTGSAVPVILSIGGVTSNTVTIAVQ